MRAKTLPVPTQLVPPPAWFTCWPFQATTEATVNRHHTSVRNRVANTIVNLVAFSWSLAALVCEVSVLLRFPDWFCMLRRLSHHPIMSPKFCASIGLVWQIVSAICVSRVGLQLVVSTGCHPAGLPCHSIDVGDSTTIIYVYRQRLCRPS